MNIPIAILDENGNFKKLVLGVDYLSKLAEMMRKDGPTEIHTMDDDGRRKTYKAHAVIVTAKGHKGNFMHLPEDVQ